MTLPSNDVLKFDKPVLGADPEIFLKSGAKLLPAFEFLPHKDNGISFDWTFASCSPIGKLYWDGFQAEYSFHKGESCLALLTMMQQDALKTLLKVGKKHDPKAKLSLESVVKIPTAILKTGKDDHIALGCLPSMNAYDDQGIHVADPRKLPYRFAGGHIHFGYDSDLKVDKTRVVKYLDAILAIWAVGAAKSFDNPVRRMYYGKAGEYRKPKHGLEWRTLSNFFLASPYTFEMVYEIARAVYRASMGTTLDMWAHDETMTRIAINESDTELAASILKRNKEMFLWLLSFSTLTQAAAELTYEVGLHGIEHVLKNPNDISGNWELTSGEAWDYAFYANRGHKFKIVDGIKEKLLKVQKG